LGNGITGKLAVLYIKVDGLADVGEGLLTGVTLRDASG